MGYHDGGKKINFLEFFCHFFSDIKSFDPQVDTPPVHLQMDTPPVHLGGFFFQKKNFFGGPKFTPFSVAISVLEKKNFFLL